MCKKLAQTCLNGLVRVGLQCYRRNCAKVTSWGIIGKVLKILQLSRGRRWSVRKTHVRVGCKWPKMLTSGEARGGRVATWECISDLSLSRSTPFDLFYQYWLILTLNTIKYRCNRKKLGRNNYFKDALRKKRAKRYKYVAYRSS